jgi:hypothetical protein
MDFAITNFRHVRVIESTPARNVSRCVGIGVGGESARLARELVARWPVLLADATASRTSPTGIARVNKLDRHTDEPALIDDLRLQISEGPRVQDSALLSISPDPRTNPDQIFKRDSSIRAFSNTANLFGDDVVHVPHKSLFTATESAQDTLGFACAFLLKALSLPPAASADTGHLSGIAESLPVGTLRNIHEAQVNAQPVNRLLLAFFRNVYGDVQVPLSFAKDQIRLTLGKLKQLALAFTTDKRQMFQSAIERPNAHGRGWQLNIQNPEFIGIRNLSDQQADDLRRQRKLIPNLAVEPSVQRETAEFFRFPSELRKAVSGVICRFQRFEQGVRLLGRWQQFNLDGQFHLVKSNSNP